jgi:hypothetical protein
MREYRDERGRPHLWFDPHEIEKLMETELTKAGLLSDTSAGIDIEDFIERHLQVPLDQYATDLDPGVLGLTEFFSDGSCKIRISRALSDEVDRDESCPPGIKGRWRATMAHEAAHVVMHKGLFVAAGGKQTSLFENAGPPRSQKLLRCSNEDLTRVSRPGAAQPDPEEVQANMGMAALLMPRPTFRAAAEAEIQRVSGTKTLAHADTREWMVVRALATRFQVSKQAASIRLQTLGLVLRPGERSLV